MHKIDGNKIIFSDDRIFRLLIPIDFGSTCNIYKIRIGGVVYAVKTYNGRERTTLEDIERKQKINIDSYVSPIKLLYINDKFKGYIMRYCKGGNLALRKLDISIDEFAESTIKLMEDTHKLSLLKYNIFDSYMTNGMYDKGFKMIDMDDYDYMPNKSIDDIESLNNIRLNLFLKDVFEKNTGLKDIEDEFINNLMEKCDKGEILFDEVFNIICSIAYNIADTELNNISEVGKVIKKYKKM